MQHTLSREAPAILIDVVASIVCFILGAAWWKFTGRNFDRDAAFFWTKICIGICIFAIIMDFIM